jgi:hypothetical protein
MVSTARRVQRVLEKYGVNPVMRAALRAGVAPRSFALIGPLGTLAGNRTYCANVLFESFR